MKNMMEDKYITFEYLQIIQEPMYRGKVNLSSSTVTITRDDENGKLTLDDCRRLGFDMI